MSRFHMLDAGALGACAFIATVLWVVLISFLQGPIKDEEDIAD